jgi:hypothetical protein
MDQGEDFPMKWTMKWKREQKTNVGLAQWISKINFSTEQQLKLGATDLGVEIQRKEKSGLWNGNESEIWVWDLVEKWEFHGC